MTATLNGENLDLQLEGEKTLSEVLGKIEEEISKYDAATIEVRIDGKAVGADELDGFLQKPPEEIERVDLTSISADELLAFLRELKPAILRLCGRLSDLGAKLQVNSKKEVSETIEDLSKVSQSVFGIFSYAALFPARFESKKIGGKSVSDFAKDLSAALGEFLDAYKGEDFVAVGDIAEYELSPMLQSLQDSIE